MVRLKTKVGFSNEYHCIYNTRAGTANSSSRLWKVILRLGLINVLTNVVVVTANVDTTAAICPKECRCDSILDANCSFANITELSYASLRFHYKVETLDLSHNGIRSIPELLSRQTEIVTLNLSSNLLASVPQHAFGLMWKLRSLDLSDNRIENLSRDMHAGLIFAANTKLLYLNLSGNPLLDLGDGYEQDALYSPSLLRLDVSRCDIRNVQGATALRGLPKLQRLDLSRNSRLARLDGLVSDSLEALDVSDCDIQFMRTQSIESLTKLNALRLSGNRHFSDQFGDDSKPYSKSLMILDVSRCSLLDANYGSQSSQIIRLIEKDNRIRNVPAYSFANNTNLEWLDLSRNRIEFIDEFAFYGAISLTWLDLSANAISILNGGDTFAFPSFLLVLNVSSNPIRVLPHKAIKSASLRVLDLSDCHIEAMHQYCLLELPYLRILNLSYNLLEYLPSNLTSYSLETFDFTRCRLKTLDTLSLAQLPALNRLYLSGNRFVRIKRETFNSLNFEMLTLDDNPWQCDCFDDNFHSLWRLYESVMNTQTTAVVDQPVCQHPENVTGKTWREACAEKWSQARKVTNDMIIVAVIVAVLLLCGSISCYIAFKDKYRRWEQRREESRQCREHRLQRTNEQPDAPTESGAPPPSSRSSRIDNAIDEMVQKLTQLPSYDEALLLPKTVSPFSTLTRNARPTASVSGPINRKLSGIKGTTSDETPPLLQNDNDDVVERVDSAAETILPCRKRSLQEMENISTLIHRSSVISNQPQKLYKSDDDDDERQEELDSAVETAPSTALSSPIRRKSLQEIEYINLPVYDSNKESNWEQELTRENDDQRKRRRLDSAIDTVSTVTSPSPVRRPSMQEMDYFIETVNCVDSASYQPEPLENNHQQHYESEYANIPVPATMQSTSTDENAETVNCVNSAIYQPESLENNHQQHYESEYTNMPVIASIMQSTSTDENGLKVRPLTIICTEL